MPPAKLQPALLGGLVTGFFSALPIVGWANGCCCLWVVGGAVLAAYLMQQNHPLPVTIADGALVGLLSGVFGALMAAVISIPVDLLFGDMQRRIAEQWLDAMRVYLPPDANVPFPPPEAGSFSIGWWVMSLALMIPLSAIFGMLGGILGASLFRKDQPPPSPPAPPLVPPPGS